ncbi:APC family permease [Pseudactinotalea sp. Z1739]|uniref:APC family permease n=1 Tax=Pseudactinotalea sp. Z1739 TaxID=3413028 RepID=UPI003C7B2CA4
MTTPKLERTVTLWPMVLFGLAYITPFIVLTTFGAFSEVSGGMLAGSYALTTIAMIFTAISYAKLAREFPVSGSAYTYARRAIGPRTGFMVGWAILLDYFFLPMVVWLIGTAYLTAEFPGVPGWVFLLGFILLTTILNVIGIKVATRVNLALISFQVLVLLFFVGLSLRRVFADPDLAVTTEPFWNADVGLTPLVAGAALAAYSFIGFDAVSTFSEEAVDPKRTVPRAIILTAAIAGAVFVAVAFVVQLVSAGATYPDPDSAALDIARTIGGDLFGAVFLATVIVAQFTAGIPIQAAGSRLLFAMGRDGVLPRKIFGYVSPRFRTPVFNLALTGAVGLVAVFLDVTTSTSFINFGAFTAFAFVNISVIVLFMRQRHEKHRNVLSWTLQPLLGLGVITWLLVNLDVNALTIGVIWLVLGFAWLLIMTRGLRREPPEVRLEEVVADA